MVKNKFTTLGIFAVLLVSLAMVSAAASDNNFTISINGDGTSSSPVTGASGDDISFIIDFETTNSSYLSGLDLNWSGADISSGSVSNVGNTSFSPTINIGSGQSHGLKVTVKDNSTGLVLADLSVSIYYEDNSSGSSTDSEDYTSTACYMEDGADNGVGDVGELEISDVDVENNGDGKDARWEYFDSIEVDVKVENTGDEDIKDVIVELLIIDSSGNDVTDDFLDEEEDDLGKIKDGDKDDTTFTIDVPIDAEAGDYELYVFAYSEDEGEDVQCASMIGSDYSYSFSVEDIDDDEAIDVDSDELGVSVDAYCGQSGLEIVVPIYNLADEDEEDLGEYVLVTMYNSVLGIDEYFLIEGLDGKEDDEATFYIDIPEGLDNDKYDLDINVYFDFDGEEDDDEQYEDMHYDKDNDYALRVSIIACAGNEPSIAPVLESSAVEGEELVVVATVTNNGNAGQYTVDVSGYESWAELVSVSPESVYISEDGSTEVKIVLMPTTSGTQTFQISATIDGETYNQPTTITVKENSSSFEFPDGFAIYLIAGIGGLLILILLILVIKVAKKRPVKAQF